MKSNQNFSFFPFVKVYDDTLESKKLSPTEMLVFEAIKSKADKNLTSCISYGKIVRLTGLSKTSVITIIKSLRKKHIVSVQQRLALDGSYEENRYFLHDFDSVWKNDNNNLENLISNHNNFYFTSVDDLNANKSRHFISVPVDFIKSKISICAKHIYLFLLKHLNSKTGECYPSIRRLSLESGYSFQTVRKALKELIKNNFITKKARYIGAEDGYTGRQTSNQYDFVKRPTKVNEEAIVTDNNNNQPEAVNWSEEFIKKYFDFDFVNSECDRLSYNKGVIPIIIDTLHEVFNTADDKDIKIGSGFFKTKVIKSVYEKLNWQDILYVIKTYNGVTHKIKNISGYIKTMLYRAKNQADADVVNQVNTDFPQYAN